MDMAKIKTICMCLDWEILAKVALLDLSERRELWAVIQSSASKHWTESMWRWLRACGKRDSRSLPGDFSSGDLGWGPGLCLFMKLSWWCW